MGDYRVRYKSGEVEIEVESTDKQYVDTMVNKLVAMQPPAGSSGTPKGGKKKKGTKSRSKEGKSTATDQDEPKVDVQRIVNSIHESDDFNAIEEHILNKRAQLPRVLLVLYFAQEEGVESLTPTQISEITNELRVEIAAPNVSQTIRNNRRFFSTKTKGSGKIHNLNRQGLQAFEKYREGKKP